MMLPSQEDLFHRWLGARDGVGFCWLFPGPEVGLGRGRKKAVRDCAPQYG